MSAQPLPAPVAYAALSNRVALLFKRQAELGKTMLRRHRRRSCSPAGASRGPAHVHDGDADLVAACYPEAGAGYDTAAASASADAPRDGLRTCCLLSRSQRETDKASPRHPARAAAPPSKSHRHRCREDADDDDDAQGRSVLGKRKRPRPRDQVTADTEEQRPGGVDTAGDPGEPLQDDAPTSKASPRRRHGAGKKKNAQENKANYRKRASEDGLVIGLAKSWPATTRPKGKL